MCPLPQASVVEIPYVNRRTLATELVCRTATSTTVGYALVERISWWRRGPLIWPPCTSSSQTNLIWNLSLEYSSFYSSLFRSLIPNTFISMAFTIASSSAVGLRTHFAGARLSSKVRASRASPVTVVPQAAFWTKTKATENAIKKAARPSVRPSCT